MQITAKKKLFCIGVWTERVRPTLFIYQLAQFHVKVVLPEKPRIWRTTAGPPERPVGDCLTKSEQSHFGISLCSALLLRFPLYFT